MTKIEIQTNLIGRRVCISMGLDMDDKESMVYARSMAFAAQAGARKGLWHLFDKEGEIVGAFLNEHKRPEFLINVDGKVTEASPRYFELTTISRNSQ